MNDLDPLGTALVLLRRGWWPVPLHPGQKRPIGDGWGRSRPAKAGLRERFHQYPGAGLGLMLGPDAGLVDLEVDGPEGEDSLLKLFGGESVVTLGWSSRRGVHRLFSWDERLAALANGSGVIKLASLPGLEIRVVGAGKQLQSACPPTVTDGYRRCRLGPDEVAPLPEAAFSSLEAARAAPPSGAEAGPPATPSDPCIAWFRRALENEAGRVALALEGGRHKVLLAAARTLGGYLHHGRLYEAEVAAELTHAARRAGLDASEAAETVRDGLAYGKAAPLPWPDRLSQPGGGAGRGEDAARSTRDAGPHQPTPASASEGVAERPVIVISTEEHEVIDRAVDALSADPEIYQRGHMLVRMVRERRRPKGGLRAEGSPRIGLTPTASLRERLARFASWVRARKTRDGDEILVAAHPPEWAVAGVAARGEWDAIRYLESVVETPALRLDGSLLETPGYDEETGLLYEPNATVPRSRRPRLGVTRGMPPECCSA